MVLDHFHVIRLANDAIGDARRRVQRQTVGHRGRAKDPLYATRRLLLVAEDRLSARARLRVEAALTAGDPTGELRAAWTAKELLRDVYAANDLRSPRRALLRFYEWWAEADTIELRRLALSVNAWHDEVLAFHSTGASNGPTEAVNLLIEKVRRIGHGFRSFENYRLRLLLRCGVQWHSLRRTNQRPSTTLGRVEPVMTWCSVAAPSCRSPNRSMGPRPPPGQRR